MLLTIKLSILYNMFTYMLILQSRSHYLYFIDVGNEDQTSDKLCHMANKSDFNF